MRVELERLSESVVVPCHPERLFLPRTKGPVLAFRAASCELRGTTCLQMIQPSSLKMNLQLLSGLLARPWVSQQRRTQRAGRRAGGSSPICFDRRVCQRVTSAVHLYSNV